MIVLDHKHPTGVNQLANLAAQKQVAELKAKHLHAAAGRA